MKITHDRFNRTVWAIKKDFTGALAKYLVIQSPYTVPENLSTCIEKFDQKLDKLASFDTNGMAEISLLGLTANVNSILESIPEIMALNEPNDDFIDILAVAQNITCAFAEEAESQCYREHCMG